MHKTVMATSHQKKRKKKKRTRILRSQESYELLKIDAALESELQELWLLDNQVTNNLQSETL